MNYYKGNSGLTLPVNTGKMSNSRDISVQAITDWCSQLQLSDLSGCAKALFLTLQDSHQAPITYQERFEILSILRPTLKYITQALQKFYEEQEVLSDTQRPIADLVNALHTEMINGYKLVIEEAIKPLFYNHHIFISSVQNAMSYCTKVIFFSYEQHRAPPQGMWLELHEIYNFAKERRIDKKSLQKYCTWQCRFNTIADIYKHCLLFSISNPSHLRKAQIIQLLYAIEYWAPLLVIKDHDKTDSCLFFVDPLQDEPPRYIGLFEQSPKIGYFMDLTQINERISKLLSLYGNNNHEKVAKLFSASELALPLHYLESIHQSFKNLRKRTNERLKANGEIKVCLGISSCHWFASQNDHDTINLSIPENTDITLSPEQSAALPVSKFVIYRCEIVNHSERGYCLNWIEKVPLQLQTGEIIGIETQIEDNIEWSIGTIRWLRNEGTNSTLVGIELLSKESLPVKAHLSDSASPYLVPTLVFPPQAEKQLPMRLVSPPLPFKVGNEIELEYDGHVYAAVLQKSYSASASYQEFGLHFAYQALEFPRKSQHLPPKASSSLLRKKTD